MSTLGERLVEWLAACGIDTVFGIPGVHTVEMYRALAGGPVAHVTPRHEQGGGFMADGHARVTGRPAALFVITGPGLTNALSPMAQAHADSVPMLVVSSVSARGAPCMSRSPATCSPWRPARCPSSGSIRSSAPRPTPPASARRRGSWQGRRAR